MFLVTTWTKRLTWIAAAIPTTTTRMRCGRFRAHDSLGAGVEGYYYDAYGYQTVVLPGPGGILDFGPDDVYVPGAPSSVGNPFLFTSQRFDPETGLLYYKNRHDSTFFGRFMQRDPLDYETGDINLYEYVHGRPTFATDPSGLDWNPFSDRVDYVVYDFSENKDFACNWLGAGGAIIQPGSTSIAGIP